MDRSVKLKLTDKPESKSNRHASSGRTMRAVHDLSTLIRPGLMVGGSYRLVYALASGAMGALWVAEHANLGSRVAVKFVAGRCDDEMRRRFGEEARTVARLVSRFVPSIYDTGSLDDGTAYLVMELLEGENLEERLSRKPPLTPSEIQRVIVQTCRALSATHSQGIVHRDVKPGNMFLERTGNVSASFDVKLLDFGVALLLDKNAMRGSIPAMVGTPQYMSPEQVRNDVAVDHRSDLYALGLVAFRMLTGRAPFQADNRQEMLLARLNSEVPRATEFDPSLPRSIDAWMARACAIDPEARFDDARLMSDEFIRAWSGEPPPARGQPVPSRRISRRIMFMGIGLGTILLAAIVVSFVARSTEPVSAKAPVLESVGVRPTPPPPKEVNSAVAAHGERVNLPSRLPPPPPQIVRPSTSTPLREPDLGF